MAPLFSIAIPAFKIDFFEECLQSVLRQSYQDFEVIIVNDASPDPLEDVVSKFDDPRIVYKKNEVGFGGYNVCGNWTECLKLARGKYFMCIGDDDKLLPDCLEKYVELIKQYPDFKIYHAGTQFINEKSEIINYQEPRPIVESAWSMIWHRWFKNRSIIIGDFLFQTAFLKEQGGFVWFPYAWGSDECTAFLIAARGGGIANMQDFGFQYRYNDKSISNSRTIYKEKVEACAQKEEWLKSFLREAPKDPVDLIYWEVSCRGIKDHFGESFKRMITLDIKANHSIGTILYWLKTGKKYQVSVPAVILCILHGLS